VTSKKEEMENKADRTAAQQGPQYPISPDAQMMSIYELQQVTFGDTKLGSDGLMLRMKSAENTLEHYENVRRSAKAFAAGLAINILFSTIALLKQFGVF
jgi:hypothetical protein